MKLKKEIDFDTTSIKAAIKSNLKDSVSLIIVLTTFLVTMYLFGKYMEFLLTKIDGNQILFAICACVIKTLFCLIYKYENDELKNKGKWYVLIYIACDIVLFVVLTLIIYIINIITL